MNVAPQNRIGTHYAYRIVYYRSLTSEHLLQSFYYKDVIPTEEGAHIWWAID